MRACACMRVCVKMVKPALLLSCVGLAAGAAVAIAANNTSHLKHLLFYTCATKEVLNQCEESFTLDQNESANLGFTSNLTTAVDGFREANMRTLYAVHDIFFANEQGMQKDYLTNWKNAKSVLHPLILEGVIAGFFIGDELFPGKISVQNLTTALSLVAAFKEEFPPSIRDSLIVWENEGGTSWVDYVNKELGGKLPAGLDVFSIDDYSMTVEQHREFHEQTIYPMLHPHQRVWLVPGAFATNGAENQSKSEWCCGGDTFEACDACMVNRTRDFFNWAAEDPNITGFAPWHW